MKNPQSVILTGESGSGKTKNTEHLLSFFCNSYKDLHRVSATNLILELFGNAKTAFNENSSRFTKLTQVIINVIKMNN